MAAMDFLSQILLLWIYITFTIHVQATMDPVFASLDDHSTDLAMVMRNGNLDYHIWQDELDIIEEVENHKGSFTEPPEDFDTDKVGNETRIKRFAMDKEWRRWKHGVIPYEFDNSVGEKRRQHILNDIFGLFQYWTHFRFVPWNSSVPELYNLDHDNYLIFVAHDNRCWSYLGNTRVKGQHISCCIQDRCIHEIGHSLGFYHELESPLRDDYIRINSENIIDGLHANFHKSSLKGKKVFGYYDMSTVMGYAPNSFSKNMRDTISVLDPESRYLTIKKDMSAYYMFYEAQVLYGMKAEKCPEMSDDCVNGGYLSFVNGTCRCRCPKGLDYTTNCSTAIGSDVCGGVIQLSAERKQIKITSGNYPAPYRVSQPCVWLFKGRPGSKLKLDFERFNILPDDKTCSTFLEIRFALPGQPGVKYCGDGFRRTIVSQGEYLSMHLDTSTMYGNAYVKFSVSVSVVEAEDMCYSSRDKGNSYRGQVNYSRDFQPCLAWDKVVNCTFNTFTVKSMDLEQNYCRNPGHGTEPWCYVNAENCERAYCDVCHLRKCRDLFDNCESELLKNPFYCFLNIEARRGCRRTCEMCAGDSIQGRNIQCSPPPRHIGDGEVVSHNGTTYRVGDTVTYTCTHEASNGSGNSTCTSDGTWTYIGYVCSDNPSCVDKRSDCNVLLNRNPTMCMAYREFSSIQCTSTCGLCKTSNNTISKIECQPDWYMIGNVTEASQGPYYVGDVVTFKCATGYIAVVGDIQRACQGDGKFTGIEPRCNAVKDTVTDLFHVSISRRSRTSQPNTIYIFSNSFYRIQRQGELIAWEFYSLYRGQVYFQVWRQAGNSTSYKLLSSFHVGDTNGNRKVTVYVPLQQRVTVEPGDFIGVYLPEENAGGIMYDNCKTRFDPQGGGHLTLSNPGPWNVGQYYTMNPSTACYLFSVSAKIGPMRKVDIQALRLSWYRFLNRHG